MEQKNIYDFTVKANTGFNKQLDDYKGKVLLIVNTASRCGFTPQYEGLQKLYDKFTDLGFEILAFPSNQFMNQEPGSDSEIKSFCQINYNIRFPIFSKIDVNGPNADPLFSYLTKSAPGIFGSRDIKWNFTKFLIDRNGKVVKRYAPLTKPEKIEYDIRKIL
ncbi:MAG TPA: glutathione peroxidase [Spirochaetota bacterium]|nr:glutathione peroxidase [Spirochaetota bacterium]HPI87866.1 glutathione peroxidase [Spirochaetota bacterium]HPR47402.1 glutathione peroxidase [Spirochaetota bacterium]